MNAPITLINPASCVVGLSETSLEQLSFGTGIYFASNSLRLCVGCCASLSTIWSIDRPCNDLFG